MKKLFYYLRVITFIAYLIVMFLLIDKLYKPDIWSIIYFIFSFIYIIIMILTFLSKKEIFKRIISYNILNTGLYAYTFVIYYLIFDASNLEILANESYFHHNYLMLCILMITLSIFAILLNRESDLEKDNN